MGFALFRRPPDPPHLDVNHAGKRFRVSLRRRNTARRITLRVSSATGDIVLTLPQRTDLDTARRFADAHGDWIATRIAKVPRRVRLAHGAKLPFRGVPHRIVHWSAIRGVTSATLDPYGEPVIAVTGEPAHVARRVREFLEREARRDLAEAVIRHTAALGVPARRLTLAPPCVLDYLAAHEVAHLKEINHSHRFWRIVHGLCERTEEAERWLKRHGSELHKFG